MTAINGSVVQFRRGAMQPIIFDGFYHTHVLLYQHWANSILCEVGIVVENIEEFQNGALLAVLVDLLWPAALLQKQLQDEGLAEELNEETALQCTRAVIDYLHRLEIKLLISPQDIVGGDVKSLLDLLWILILHFTIHSPDQELHKRTVKWGKRKLLEWCASQIGHARLDVTKTISHNLCHDSCLTQLISAICDVQLVDQDPLSGLTSALLAADEQLGISKHILDPLSVINNVVEEHSLLVYVALLRRKALLIEDLAPHEQAAAHPGTGLPAGSIPIKQQWSSMPLPPEALQAMGLDGDYVMYAIVEEHFMPQDSLDGDKPFMRTDSMTALHGQFDQIQLFEEPMRQSTIKISEIFSEDESDRSNRSSPHSGARFKSSTNLSKSDDNERGESSNHESGDDAGFVYFNSKPKARNLPAAAANPVSDPLVFMQHDQFTDGGEEEGRSGNPVPWMVMENMLDVKECIGLPVDDGIRLSEMPPSTSPSTSRHNSSSDTSFTKMDQAGGNSRKCKTSRVEKVTRGANITRRSVQEDIAALLAKEGLKDDTMRLDLRHEPDDPDDEEVQDAEVVETLQAMRQLLTHDDLEQFDLLGESNGHMACINLNETSEWGTMSQYDNSQHSASYAHLRQSDDGDIPMVIRRTVEASLHNGSTAPPSSNDSTKVGPSSNSSRSSYNLSPQPSEGNHQPDGAEERHSSLVKSGDELLELLDSIGKQGVVLQAELKKAYAREFYLEHEKILESDSLVQVVEKLNQEINALRAEKNDINHKLQATFKTAGSKDLEQTIQELERKLHLMEKDKKSRHMAEMVNKGTVMERVLTLHKPSQTTSSISRLHSQEQQTVLSLVEKAVQTTCLAFSRSRMTSTDDLNSTRDHLIDSHDRVQTTLPHKSTLPTRHKAVQTSEVIYDYQKPLNNGYVPKTFAELQNKLELNEMQFTSAKTEIPRLGQPSSNASRVLDQMLSQVTTLSKSAPPAKMCAFADQQMTLFADMPEGPEKWQQMAMTPLSKEPLVLMLQRSLASAALENKVLHAEMSKAASAALQSPLMTSSTDSGLGTSKTIFNADYPNNPHESEMNKLRERIAALEETLTTAQIDNTKLTGKIEEALNMVKENLDMSTPQRLKRVEQENQLLKKKLALTEEDRNYLEKSERELLQTEVSVLREEYEYIKQGMNLMQRFFNLENNDVEVDEVFEEVAQLPQMATPHEAPNMSQIPLNHLISKMEREMKKTHSASKVEKLMLSKSRLHKKNHQNHEKNHVDTNVSDAPASKVQKELERRFPKVRSRTSKSLSPTRPYTEASKDDLPKLPKSPGEIRPLVQASDVQNMTVEELRKQRLAMLIQSFTGHQDPNDVRKRLGSDEIGGETEDELKQKRVNVSRSVSPGGRYHSGSERVTHPRRPRSPIPTSRTWRGKASSDSHATPDSKSGLHTSAPKTVAEAAEGRLPYLPKQRSVDSTTSPESEPLSLPDINSGSVSEVEFLSLPSPHVNASEHAKTSRQTSKSVGDDVPYFMRARQMQRQQHRRTPTQISSATTDSGVSDVGSLGRQSTEEKLSPRSPSKQHSPRLSPRSSSHAGSSSRASHRTPTSHSSHQDQSSHSPPRDPSTNSRLPDLTRPYLSRTLPEANLPSRSVRVMRSTNDKSPQAAGRAPWKASRSSRQTSKTPENTNSRYKDDSDSASTSSSVHDVRTSVKESKPVKRTDHSRSRTHPGHEVTNKERKSYEPVSPRLSHTLNSSVSKGMSQRSASPSKTPVAPWHRNSHKPKTFNESSDESTDDLWKEPKRYDYRYGSSRREVKPMDYNHNTIAGDKSAVGSVRHQSSSLRSQSPASKSGVGKESPSHRSHSSSQRSTKVTSPRPWASTKSSGVNAKTVAQQLDAALLDDPGNQRSTRPFIHPGLSANSKPLASTRGGHLSEEQKAYANTLIDQYTQQWKQRSLTITSFEDDYDPTHYEADCEPDTPQASPPYEAPVLRPQTRMGDVFDRERDYVGSLVDKYAVPAWP